jgi:hypothetical protein
VAKRKGVEEAPDNTAAVVLDRIGKRTHRCWRGILADFVERLLFSLSCFSLSR